MRLIAIVFISFLPFSYSAKAFEMEAFAGVNSTTYDEVSDANSYGISLRTKLNFYGATNNGVFTVINARGVSLVAADTLTGYAWRTGGTWFFEIGGGLSYSAIFGPGVGVLAGTGYRFASNLFINFPLIYGTTGAFWSPYIGYTF